MNTTETQNEAGRLDGQTQELLNNLTEFRDGSRATIWNFLLWWTVSLLAVCTILLIAGIWIAACLRISLALGALWLAVSAAALFFPRWRLASHFKHHTLAGLCRLIDPELRFVPDSGIGAVDYRKSELFPVQYDRFSGKNLFAGKCAGIPLSFSELHTQYRTVTRSENRKRTAWHTIFQGIFFKAELPGHLPGRVIILAESAGESEKRLAGESLKQLFSAPRGTRFDPGNAEFSGVFSVYAENAEDARALLTAERMDELLKLRARMPGKIHFSFAENTFYAAMETGEGLLKMPRSLAKATADDLRQTLRNVRLFSGIVNDLHLNQTVKSRA